MRTNFMRFRLLNLAESEEGLGSTDANSFANAGDANENFDDLDYVSEASKAVGEKFQEKFKDKIERAKKAKEELEGDKPKAEKKEIKKDEKKTDLDLLDDDMEEKKEEKKETKKESKKEEKEEVEAKTEEAKKEEEKTEAKKLKIRMSDGLYGIESDAKVRVKIDGDYQEVPVQELINQYSGKVAYDKKFSEITNEKKALEMKTSEVTKKTAFIQETVANVLSHLNDPNKNPLDALYFLVDKTGHDTYDIYKKTLEANLEEVEKLMSMSEIERKAYFLEKKDEFRTKTEEARKAESSKVLAFNQAVQKVDSLRQAHGVSEEQYLQALDQLESEGQDTTKMTDEQVVDYASLKPHITTIQDVLEPFEDSIADAKYSEVVQNLARQLRAKEFTKEQITEWARKEFMDDDLKDLQVRTQEVQKKTSKVETKKPEKFETLDFDDEE